MRPYARGGLLFANFCRNYVIFSERLVRWSPKLSFEELVHGFVSAETYASSNHARWLRNFTVRLGIPWTSDAETVTLEVTPNHKLTYYRSGLASTQAQIERAPLPFPLPHDNSRREMSPKAPHAPKASSSSLDFVLQKDTQAGWNSLCQWNWHLRRTEHHLLNASKLLYLPRDQWVRVGGQNQTGEDLATHVNVPCCVRLIVALGMNASPWEENSCESHCA
jgi:hypothetical protein